MRRTSLVLAAAGGVAVLAVTGVALGVTAADRSSGRSTPAAVTVADDPARVGDDDSAGTAPGDDNPARSANGAEDDPARSTNGGDDNPARAATADDGSAPAATSGEDNPARQGRDDDGTGTAPAAGRAVSRQRAAEVALARTGGGRVTEIEAETEHGRPAWSVKVVRDGWRHEVKVDRGTGAVLAAERLRPDADDRGGRDDHSGRDDRGTDDRSDDHGHDHGDDRDDD
ncbi:PepSY domain-containing protein [Micromonospora sp. WMMD1128]|uniref:PepSY domain-containing protein n=1 Tax=Micromonospora sp. WMMD1128 TaxID=3015150 RepID=UPI00248B3B07|nr:PepSY domain-containing protein [Micromonospora sp. WMMD1128]WBB72540.1 PepSY domain-containing protein [Micromonospora sp. WMMD1128]